MAALRLNAFLAGLLEYSKNEMQSWNPDARIIWQQGTTKIYDYGGQGRRILVISPLINKANILDIADDISFVRNLRALGYAPLLVSWGEPAQDEKDFDSAKYVERLEGFLATQENCQEFVYAGYCMGGLLALKLAAKMPPAALILLATPWNFDAPDLKKIRVKAENMAASIAQYEFVPPEFIQTLFYYIDPWRVCNKYSRLNEMDDATKARFIHIENWANDGVAMAKPMAQECLVDWLVNNQTGKGKWLDAAGIKCPTFIACPLTDKIVPIGCSIPLAGVIPQADLQKFECGHIGLVTKDLLYKPLAEWLAAKLDNDK